MALEIGKRYTIEGRVATLVKISEQMFMGRYYTVDDGRGQYSYDQDAVARLGGFDIVHERPAQPPFVPAEQTAEARQAVNQRMFEYYFG
jgi:hypothetical protein